MMSIFTETKFLHKLASVSGCACVIIQCHILSFQKVFWKDQRQEFIKVFL